MYLFQSTMNMELPVYPYVKEGTEHLYYKCPYCKGWIKGRPLRRHEDSAAILAGRRGTVTYCIRCGREIDFDGMCF